MKISRKGLISVLIPAALITVQNLLKNQVSLKGSSPIKSLLKEAAEIFTFYQNSIVKVDSAVPLLILSGISYPKLSFLVGFVYAAAKQMCMTRFSNKDLVKVGDASFRLSLLTLSILAVFSVLRLFLGK